MLLKPAKCLKPLHGCEVDAVTAQGNVPGLKVSRAEEEEEEEKKLQRIQVFIIKSTTSCVLSAVYCVFFKILRSSLSRISTDLHRSSVSIDHRSQQCINMQQ